MKTLDKSSAALTPPKAEVEGSNPFGSASFCAIDCTRAPRTARERTLSSDTLVARVFVLHPARPATTR